MNKFRMTVTRAGRPANRPAATTMAYRCGYVAVFRKKNMMSFLRKFMLGMLVACALMAPPSAVLASTAHPAVAAQSASHPLKVCDIGDLCI